MSMSFLPLKTGGGKGFRVDYEALPWRTIQTKNKQAALIHDRHPVRAFLLLLLCSPLFWQLNGGRNLYILSQLYYHPFFCNA
jgi:hypothetical protein